MPGATNAQSSYIQIGAATKTPIQIEVLSLMSKEDITVSKFIEMSWPLALASRMGRVMRSKTGLNRNHPRIAPTRIPIAAMTARLRSSRRWSPRDILASGFSLRSTLETLGMWGTTRPVLPSRTDRHAAWRARVSPHRRRGRAGWPAADLPLLLGYCWAVPSVGYFCWGEA